MSVAFSVIHLSQVLFRKNCSLLFEVSESFIVRLVPYVTHRKPQCIVVPLVFLITSTLLWFSTLDVLRSTYHRTKLSYTVSIGLFTHISRFWDIFIMLRIQSRSSIMVITSVYGSNTLFLVCLLNSPNSLETLMHGRYYIWAHIGIYQ